MPPWNVSDSPTMTVPISQALVRVIANRAASHHSAVAILTTAAEDGIEAARARLADKAAIVQPALADLTVPRAR